MGDKMQKSCVIVLAALFLVFVSAESVKYEVTSLPGLDIKLDFKQWSGYVEVNEAQGRNLFFWFVESSENPANAPLVLWLTGGPGCSGLLALTTENGPFRINPINS